jgi:cysteinyl-tRNA synthetase
MDDDLSIPSALAVMHESVRSGNHALDSGDSETALRVASEVRAMASVLGIDPLAPEWKESGVNDEVLGAVVDSMIALRWQAKAEKNFALSDSLRDALDNAGIDVHDGPSGSTWSLRG